MNSMNTQARKMYKHETLMSLGHAKVNGKNAVICGINLTVGNVKNALLFSLHNYLLEMDSTKHPKKRYAGLLLNGKSVAFTHRIFRSTIDDALDLHGIEPTADDPLDLRGSHHGRVISEVIIDSAKELINKIKHNPHVLRCNYSQLNCLELSILNMKILMDHAHSNYGNVTYDMLTRAIKYYVNKTTATESVKDLLKHMPHSKHYAKKVKDAQKTADVPVSLKTVTDKYGIRSYQTSVNMEVPENDYTINTVLMGYLAIDHAFKHHESKCTISLLSGSKMSINMNLLLKTIDPNTTSIFFSDEFENNMFSLMNRVVDQPPKLYLSSSQAESIYNIGVLLISLTSAHGLAGDALALKKLIPLLKNIEEYSIHHSPNIYVSSKKTSLPNSIKAMLKNKQLSTLGKINFGGNDDIPFCALNMNIPVVRHVVILASKLYPSVFNTLKRTQADSPTIVIPNGHSYQAPSDLIHQLHPLINASYEKQLKTHVVPKIKKLNSSLNKDVLVLDQYQLLALSKAIKVTSLVTSCFELMKDFHVYLNLIGLVMHLYKAMTK